LTRQIWFQIGHQKRYVCKCDLIRLERQSATLVIIKNISLEETNQLDFLEIYKDVFQNAIHGLLLTNDSGEIVSINNTAKNALQLHSQADVENFNIAHFQNFEQSSSLDEEFHKKLAPYLYAGEISTEICLIDSKFYEVITTSHFKHGLNLTILRDISAMIKMFEQMNKHDTLSVVGQLAAGIAHEIRNPMTALKGFIQLLESSVEEDHSMYFGVINSELARIESIMTEFLMLAKPKTSALGDVSIPEIIKETAELMKAQATMYDIEIHASCADKGVFLYGDPNRLKQVLINLVKNSIEAISSGGIISISYEADEYGQSIKVSDSGCGIPSAHLEKLNEPFYTTKENGTGLSLVVTFKIVEEHGGTIVVESEIDKGTVFHLNFPHQKEG